MLDQTLRRWQSGACAIVLVVLAAAAVAAPTLVVTETAGDYYTITAEDSADPAVEFWEIRVDIASGGIYSFKDLTDAGDGGGGHTNYLGASGYNRQCTLLCFDGRGGNVGSRRGALGGLADRLSFDAAPDGSAFTITYTETAAAASFFHDSYAAGAKSLTPGDLLTTITVTIRPPTGDGTFWDWRLECVNVSDHELDPRIWADETVTTWLHDAIVRTADSENSRADGPYDESNLVSFARWTIGDNAAAGLTAGREFILDYQTGLSSCETGGTISEGVWAGFGFLDYNSAFNFEALPLPPGETRVHAGQFIIDIIGATPGSPIANAGPDQTPTAPTPDGVAVTLDGSGSSDLDGTIVSYVWTEDAAEIATGVSPQVDLAVGFHVIVLTVTDDAGLTDTDTVVIDVGLAGSNRLFYVDFDGGDDTAHGRSATAAWKHCPGDVNATGMAIATTLAAGDTVIFKGGVHYRGSITANGSGTPGDPVVYNGNAAGTWGTGMAVIDGSEPLTGWVPCTGPTDGGDNVSWANVYKVALPAGVTTWTANLYDGETLLAVSQDPEVANPLYYDDLSNCDSVPAANVTETATEITLTDSSRFTQAASDYWDGAYLHLWGLPAQMFTLEILSLDTSTDTVTLPPLAGGAGPYTDRDSLYSVGNHLSILDSPGEYVVDDTTNMVYLWPLVGGPPTGITVSVRTKGFDFGGQDYVTVQGFRGIKHSAGWQGYHGGTAFRVYSASTGAVVQDCEAAYNRSMEKYAAIYFSDATDSVIDGCYVHENLRARGIMVLGGTNNTVSNCLVQKVGGTGIYMPGVNGAYCRYNTVTDNTGGHANGITFYQGANNVECVGNVVHGGANGVTMQVSSNLVIAYNYFETDLDTFTAVDWGGACTGVEFYNNVIVNDYAKALSIPEGSIVRNNIIDGSFAGSGANVTHNIYTSLAWSQTPGYGWFLGTGEIVQTDKDLIFVDAANRDCRLIAGSPAIDAGIDVGYTSDLAGNPVPVGTAPDIGAYEGAFSAATPGDADGDGDVDLDDFVILKQTFGQSPLIDDRADFDGDGDVDLDDFVILKQNFGT